MTEMACRHCGSSNIASLDQYLGTCVGVVTADLEFEPGGYTEIHWDSCEQIGWECRNCFTEEKDEDLAAALNRLVKASP